MIAPLSGPPCCVIQRGKQKSVMLAEAVIAGCCGGQIMYEPAVQDIPEDFTPVFIGINPRTSEALHAMRRARRPFVTVDNGYFRPWKEGGYLRATTNAIQWIASRPGSGLGRDYDCAVEGKVRYDALDQEVKPWRTEDNGGPILVVLQSPMWYADMRVQPGWLEWVTSQVRLYTDREIIVREKPILKGSKPQPPLEEQLEQVSTVIGFTSMVLLKAAMRGVPIIALGYCAVSPFAGPTIHSLFRPWNRERESVLHALAANQWTVPEFASGKMWRDLQARYEPEFLTLA